MNNPQVGGVYPVKDREGLSFRVLAVDDTQVKIIHVQDGREHGETTISRHYFDKATFPEDHGPIPELVEALRDLVDARWMVTVDWAPSADYDAVIAKARAALDKVKTTAVPDSEEVAA